MNNSCLAALRKSALISFALLFSSFAAAQFFIIEPASPRAHETIRIKALKSFIPVAAPAVVTMESNKIKIVQTGTEPFIGPSPIPGANRIEHVIGPLPAGVYILEYYDAGQGLTTPPVLTGTTTITVAAASVNRSLPYPAYNYTDMWWNAAQSGWGIGIHTKNDKLFATWFVYDASGRPNWYTFQAGNWTANNVYSGLVVKVTGPALFGVAESAGTPTTAVQAGTATLTFTGYDTATFIGTADGVAFNKAITRQPF